MAQLENNWYCKSCTFKNNEFMDDCEMCNSAKPIRWQCFKCTLWNDAEKQTCVACGASKLIQFEDEQKKDVEIKPDVNMDQWQCLKCTLLNSMEVNQCIICSELRSSLIWKCKHCTTLNSIETNKICTICNNHNDDKYWKCDKCTSINDKHLKNCGVCSINDSWNNQQIVPLLPSIGAFVPFIDDKNKNKTITVILSRDNAIQRQHFDHFKEVINELNSSPLFINTSFMEKQLDSNNYHFATTFIDVIQEFAGYIRRNNEEILQEIKMAIECQTYQPKERGNDISTMQPIWNHLNQCVIGLFERANEFLELRDQFIIILMDIMWKSDKLQIKESIIEKLKKNIENTNNEELKINNDDLDNKVFTSLNKIREILPGKEYFVSILNNLPIKADEIKDCVNKLNRKCDEHDSIYNQRAKEIESKKKQVTIKKNIIDQERQHLDQANQNNNYDLAKTYCDRCNDLVIDHNKLVNIIDEDIRKLNKFSETFKNTIDPIKQEIERKKQEYNKLILNLETVRSLVGIKGDNLIEEFLEKKNNLMPLSMRIYSRIMQFEVLISTLSELLIRGIDDNQENNSPKIEWYFVQPQVRLNDFVKPLNEMNINTIGDFKNMYKGNIDLFKNELMPYLEKKIQRKIKLAEKRRLRTICQAKKT